MTQLHSVRAALTLIVRGPETQLTLETTCKDSNDGVPTRLWDLDCRTQGTKMTNNLLPNLTGIKRTMALHDCKARWFAKFLPWSLSSLIHRTSSITAEEAEPEKGEMPSSRTQSC